MAIRTTMATLVARIRVMISDPSGASAVFTDDTIQEVLDLSRVTVRYGILRCEPTLMPGGILSYTDFFADVGGWEDATATTLYSPSYAVLTPTVFDVITGHWSFTTTQVLPVFIVGNYYDIYSAAADLCERMAATMARAYDFMSDGKKFSRSQMMTALLRMAATYRSQARARTIPIIREDIDSNGFGWPINDLAIDSGWH